MKSRAYGWCLAGLVVIGLAASSVFVVPEGMQAKASHTSEWLSPGLHLRWPLHKLSWRDQRQQLLVASGSNEQPYLSATTYDHHDLQVGYMALWQVSDMSLYEKQWSDEAAAAAAIRALINQTMSQCCLSQTLAQWLDQRNVNTTELQALTAVNAALKPKGLRVNQLQVTALIVPAADRDVWLDGMKSRGQAALDQLQVQTSMLAANLRAEVDAKVAQTLATAKQQAEQSRSQADLQATSVYAAAYNQSPAFYEFYTNLQTYRQVFKVRPPVLVLNSESPFLKTMVNGVEK
jgi:membrane protease subunit HflC